MDTKDKYFLNHQFKRIVDEVYHGDKKRFGETLGSVNDIKKPMSVQSINTYYNNKQAIGHSLAMTIIKRLGISEMWLYNNQGSMIGRTSKDIKESEIAELVDIKSYIGDQNTPELGVLIERLEVKLNEINNIIQQIKNL